VIVGECRGPEALDMIQAMNTGHDGSMTNGPRQQRAGGDRRLEVLVLMAADLPVASIHRQVASALDAIVHISRMPGGSRKITQIAEVVRYDPDEKTIILNDIFTIATASRSARPAICRRSSIRSWGRNCWIWNFYTEEMGARSEHKKL